MRICFAILAMCALTAVGGQTSTERQERRQWRLSVGASVIGGVKPRLAARAARMSALSGFGRFTLQNTKEAAYMLGSGETLGYRKFDGGAFFDPSDSGDVNDDNWSWNWRLHDRDFLDGDGKIGFTEYNSYVVEELDSISTEFGGGFGSGSSEWFPGLRVEATRELYCSDDERPWGVDIAVAFAYYFQRGLWKADGTAARATATGTRTEGKHEWWNDSDDWAQYILGNGGDIPAELGQFHGGMWGAGTFDGPGAELMDEWGYRDVTVAQRPISSAHTLRYYGDGDYREYAVELLARPWWEPWDWLRLFASLGLEVSRREFKWSMVTQGTDGSYYSESGKERDWRVLGLFGGGLALKWYDFFLSFEALWRFGGDDLDVDGRMVRGRIGHGDWGFRASLGYEF